MLLSAEALCGRLPKGDCRTRFQTAMMFSYTPLKPTVNQGVHKALFEAKDFALLFPLSEAAFVIGFAGAINALTMAAINGFDLWRQGTADAMPNLASLLYSAWACFIYALGCIGSDRTDPKLVELMSVFMGFDVCLSIGMDLLAAPHMRDKLARCYKDESCFEGWAAYRVLIFLACTYGLVKVRKQCMLMRLWARTADDDKDDLKKRQGA